MRPFMFRCPNTGYIVQGQADDPAPDEKPHTYHQVTFCGGYHFVDPTTGEVAGRRKEREGPPTNDPG
jgi:hypothetical protein